MPVDVEETAARVVLFRDNSVEALTLRWGVSVSGFLVCYRAGRARRRGKEKGAVETAPGETIVSVRLRAHAVFE